MTKKHQNCKDAILSKIIYKFKSVQIKILNYIRDSKISTVLHQLKWTLMDIKLSKTIESKVINNWHRPKRVQKAESSRIYIEVSPQVNVKVIECSNYFGKFYSLYEKNRIFIIITTSHQIWKYVFPNGLNV